MHLDRDYREPFGTGPPNSRLPVQSGSLGSALWCRVRIRDCILFNTVVCKLGRCHGDPQARDRSWSVVSGVLVSKEARGAFWDVANERRSTCFFGILFGVAMAMGVKRRLD